MLLYTDGVLSYGLRSIWLHDGLGAKVPNRVAEFGQKATLNRYFVIYFVNEITNKRICYKIKHRQGLQVRT